MLSGETKVVMDDPRAQSELLVTTRNDGKLVAQCLDTTFVTAPSGSPRQLEGFVHTAVYTDEAGQQMDVIVPVGRHHSDAKNWAQNLLEIAPQNGNEFSLAVCNPVETPPPRTIKTDGMTITTNPDGSMTINM